jgi:hypothetical protein
MRLPSFVGISSFIAASSYALVAHAQDYGLGETATKVGYNRTQTIYDIVGTVTSATLGTLAIVFFGMAMYAGIRWLTARGNEEFVEKAKSTLTAAITGLIIVLGSYGLTVFILSRLQTVQTSSSGTAGGGSTTPQPQSCLNGVKDGLETDTDCGGSCDAKCKDGRVCVQPSDCVSGNCQNGACMPGGSSCTNGIRDGIESDTDCGGTVCQPCGASLKCNSTSDCVAGQTCTTNATKGYKTCGGF